MLSAKPISRKDAGVWVDSIHRHHMAAVGDMFRVAVVDEAGRVVGVAQAGRPVSRMLDDGETVEIIRCCTDGTKNACSFLYSHLARAAEALGFKRIITYTLESEPGSSLLASGFVFDGLAGGRSWNRGRRPRTDRAPTCRKKRWIRIVR